MTYSAFAYGVCRATYAAEQSVQKLEKGKKDQDLLIDHLQQQLRTHEQQIAIYSQQYDAQKRETRAAKEMLAGAEAEMEGIHFEKKQLTAQWQSSLIATQRRDQALRVSMSNPQTQTKKGGCLCTIQLAGAFFWGELVAQNEQLQWTLYRLHQSKQGCFILFPYCCRIAMQSVQHH